MPLAAVGQTAPQAPAPILCWRGSQSAVDVAPGPGEIAVTDGAHPVAWLSRPGVGQRRRGTRDRLTVRSNFPQLRLHWPGDAAVWIWARERVAGIYELTASVEEAVPDRCADRGAGAGAVLVVEAVSEARAGTCVAWPLAAAPGGGDPSRRTTCFPVGVPDLVGRPLAEAESVLESLDLLAGTIDERPAREPATVVLEQDPAAGPGRELATGDAIDLVVAGQRLVAMPDLLGLEIGRAVALLTPLDLGLVARSAGAEVAMERVAGYSIEAQDPAADSLVPAGGTATVDLSLRLPDLRGRPAIEAVSWLRERGLSPTLAGFELPAEPREAQPYSVSRHLPAAGEPVQLGGTVEIAVAIAVPELRGLSPAAARRALEGRALRLRRSSPAAGDAGAERIRSQNPAAGERLPPGSEVSAGVLVLVPDLAGATVDEATRRLTARGLRLELGGTAELERWRTESRDHRLEGQRPRPGALVAAGTTVVADLSVRLPNLLWTSAAAADADLRDLGLDPKRPRPRVPRGSLRQRVVGQEPPPGSWLAAGSPVQLVLGPGVDPPLPQPRWPWLWMTIVAVLAASLMRPRLRKPPRHLRVEGHTDFGTPKLTAAPGESARPALRLRPSWDPGRQTIETALPEEGGADA